MPAPDPSLPLAPDVMGEERSYAMQPVVFSTAEASRLASLRQDRPWSPAEVSRPGEIDPAYRSAALRWLHPRDAAWAFQRLDQVVTALNDRWFGFELAGFHDPLQLTRYDAGVSGHYDWHTDRGSFINGNPPRKLTVIVQLSDPADYAGGDLELLLGREPLRADRARGSVHVFPSFVLHRVTPVTAGARLSLVGWVVGPRFR
jgi:PKHD-type hydroxylase